MSKTKLALWVLLGVLVLALVIFLAVSKFYISWLWFGSMGFTKLFWTPFAAKWILGLASFVFAAALLGVSWGSMHAESETLPLRPLRALAVLLMSLLLSTILRDHWPDFLLFLHHTSFGVLDPVFKRDASWYVFVMPVYSLLASWLMSVVVFAIIGCIVLSQLDSRRAVPAGRLSVLGALLLLLAVWRILLSTAGLVYSARGTAFGASYTDVHAQIPANYVFIAVLVALAIYLAVNAFRRHPRAVVSAAALAVVSWVVIPGLYPAAFQKLVVAPNELARETKYLRYNIDMTKKGYGLTDVQEVRFPVRELTAATLHQYQDVVSQIRLVDWRPVQAVYQQLQELRPYYSFADLDVDRYRFSGKLQQVVLSVRELNSDRLPSTAKTWVNERLKYTHGYGFVMSPVNKITDDGEPQFLVKDFPPQGLKVTQPRIYVGELSNDYVFVDTTTPEFDYPRGDTNQYYRYQGKDGIKIGTGFRKLAIAWNYGFTKVLLSSYLKPTSRILINRQVLQRVNTIAPFIWWGKDPYAVFAKGRIFWVVEGFAWSDRFPFSEPLSSQMTNGSNLNYMRNSVKAVVDSYDGTVSLYADSREPMAASYLKAFPGFKDFSTMPSFIKAHLRYAEELFEAQSAIYRSYHMTDPQVFFNKEDQWSIPQEISGQSGDRQVEQAPYYVVNRLEGSKSPEFLVMRAFTPISKQNMSAWLAGRCDGDNYGKLVLYKFNKQSLVYGPMQVEAKVDQDTELSKSLTLWNQQGSQVLRGNTLAYPVGNSVLYVQPIYLQAEQGKIPELKKIVTFANGRLGVGDDFQESLSSIFGAADIEASAEQPSGPGGATAGPAAQGSARTIIDSALESYDLAQKYAGSGEWQQFGQALDKLGSQLRELQGQAER